MEWRDDAFVIGVRRFGEGSLVLEALTRSHGRRLGLVHGSRLGAVLQPGNAVRLVWRARLEGSLGTFAVEPTRLSAGRYLDCPVALLGLGYICVLLRMLPERDPYSSLFDALDALVLSINTEKMPTKIVHFDVKMLKECGFALDFRHCAATGGSDNLIYVSPRTGRAVSAQAGAPYRGRLFPLPRFLREGGHDASLQDILEAFRITGHFLQREIFMPWGAELPPVRVKLIAAIARAWGSACLQAHAGGT